MKYDKLKPVKTTEKIGGADLGDEMNIFRKPKDRSAFGCKAFSKDLIVRAIYPAWPQGDSKLRGLRPCPTCRGVRAGIKCRLYLQDKVVIHTYHPLSSACSASPKKSPKGSLTSYEQVDGKAPLQGVGCLLLVKSKYFFSTSKEMRRSRRLSRNWAT